jgi:hypothetical protein
MANPNPNVNPNVNPSPSLSPSPSPSPKKTTEGAKKGKAASSEGESADKELEEKPSQLIEGADTKEVTRWEKQWVAIPNVIEFGPEIWVKKWVLVQDSGETRKRSRSHSQYSEFSIHESLEDKVPKKSKKDIGKKHICQFANCGKIFFDSGSRPLSNISLGSLRKHMGTHGEKMVLLPSPKR